MSYNPFARWSITGTWAAHESYSLGGEDYPLPYGTALPAPAAGVLHTSGRPLPAGEFQCGQVGSAGRRSILMLDKPIGDVVAVVFQHQSRFGTHRKWYAETVDCGWSGASADDDDWGGEVHLHIHCLTARGQRRKFTDYFSGSTPAGGGTPITITTESEEDDMKPLYITDSVDGNGIPGWALLNTRTGKLITMRANDESWATLAEKQEIANTWGRVWGSAKHVTRLDMLNAIDAIKKTL